MKPGYEASVSGDGDRGQEPHLADFANQGVDFAERTHSFADLDRVHSDADYGVPARGEAPVTLRRGPADGGSCHAKDSSTLMKFWEQQREATGGTGFRLGGDAFNL
jgi:hypothetical protein